MTMYDLMPDHQNPEEQLADAIRTLNNSIAKAPKFSHAADKARQALDYLERSGATLTTAQRLAAVRRAAIDFKNERLVDSVLYHPGDRPPKL